MVSELLGTVAGFVLIFGIPAASYKITTARNQRRTDRRRAMRRHPAGSRR